MNLAPDHSQISPSQSGTTEVRTTSHTDGESLPINTTTVKLPQEFLFFKCPWCGEDLTLEEVFEPNMTHELRLIQKCDACKKHITVDAESSDGENLIIKTYKGK